MGQGVASLEPHSAIWVKQGLAEGGLQLRQEWLQKSSGLKTQSINFDQKPACGEFRFRGIFMKIYFH